MGRFPVSSGGPKCYHMCICVLTRGRQIRKAKGDFSFSLTHTEVGNEKNRSERDLKLTLKTGVM